MEKKCNCCNISHPISYFCKHNTTADKLSNICRICKNEKQKNYRNQNGNRCQSVYEKTKSGFLVRCYRNMLSRVNGIQKKGNYKGLPILDKNDFYSFSLKCNEFNNLFSEWNNVNYQRKYTPSIDRIDSNGGYVLGNIRWITHSENSRLGAISKWENKKNKVL